MEMEDKEKKPFCNKDVELEVHLEGKTKDSVLISLDDLQNLISGINGISKYLIKKKFGKQSRAKFDKEMQEVCSLGVKNVRPGSAILDIQAFPDGQQKLDPNLKIGNIMEEMIRLIDTFQSNEENVPLETAPYFDSLTKPLTTEESSLDVSILSDGKVTLKTKKLTIKSRRNIQTILERKKLRGGIMYGTLKEINLKDYSAKIQLFNKKLEKFSFEDSVWENIRDLLESKVEVKFEGKGTNKKMIEIKQVGSFQEKKKMTAKDLLESGVIGALKGRDDLKNSVEYAKKMADDLFK